MAKNNAKTKKTKKTTGKAPAKKNVKKVESKKTPKKATSSRTTTPRKTTTPKKADKKKATTPKKSNLKAPTKNTARKTGSSSTKKIEKRDEFRTHKENGHPSYIYQKVGSRYKYIGITHSAVTQGVKNIRLDENPNPKDKSPAYARPKPKQDKVKKFKKTTLPNWKMSKLDKQKIKPLTKK